MSNNHANYWLKPTKKHKPTTRVQLPFGCHSHYHLLYFPYPEYISFIVFFMLQVVLAGKGVLPVLVN